MYINTLNEYLKTTYGYKIYKISLDAGMTCPNRDGKISTGGCIFCSEGGSGDFASRHLPDKSISEQIEEGKKLIRKKYDGGHYIAYFQSYTNTYAGIDYLRKVFTEAITHPEVDILSIATRPDCIDEEIAELLTELSGIKPVWVELGLQTSNEESAEYINRGYSNDVYLKAVDLLKGDKKSLNKIEIITHMIIGLPNEDITDMIETVRFINKSRVNGVKLQLLHVLENTGLAKIYREEGFKIYSLEEYMDVLFRLIEELREDIVIHRMTGDGPKNILIEPKWTANKRMVLNTINRELKVRNIRQGWRNNGN